MAHGELYQFGPFCLDAQERVLLNNGRLLPLAPKALSTLLVLVRNRGHVVEKEALMAEVWPQEFVEEGNLAQHVFALRKVLGETTDVPQYIETIPRRGYRFLGTVEEFESAKVANGLLPQIGSHSLQPVSPHLLAVLPFANTSGEQVVEHLTEGIPESLINTLSRLPQVRVTAKNTVLRYQKELGDAQNVGRLLRVQSVLVGRIRVLGSKIIIAVELVDVATGWQLWGGVFDSLEKEIFDIQEEIVKKISAALELRLQEDQELELSKRHTQNPEGYQAYLKGRFYLNKRSEESLTKSIKYFREAIMLDPEYALAHVGIADCFNMLGFYSMLAPTDAFPKAKDSAMKALSLDPTLAEANASLGFAKLNYDWDLQDAEQCFKKAIQLNPNYVTTYLFYGCHLVTTGRFEEAISAYKQALEIDPLSLIANASLGYGYYFARRYEEAIDQCKATTELDDSFEMAHVWLGWAYEASGMFEESIREYEKAMSLSGGRTSIIASLGNALAQDSRTYRAQRIVVELNKMAKRRYVSPYRMACIHASLGNVDTAFEWLATAYKDRSHLLIRMHVDPKLDSIRSDPRFTRLVDRVANSTRPTEKVPNVAYLRGRYFWSNHTKEGLEQATDYFLQAIDLDPEFVPAYASIVDCYLRLSTKYFLPSDEGPELQPATQIETIEDLPAGVRASFEVSDEWHRATLANEKRRARELNLSYPPAQHWRAAYFLARRLYHDAVAKSKKEFADLEKDQESFANQFHSISLTPVDEVQIVCIVARNQIEAGNIEAASRILQPWYQIGEWPRLEGLTSQSSADLLLTAGLVAGRLASSRQMWRGQKHAEALLNGAISLFEHLGLKNRAAEGKSELARCYDREGMSDLSHANFLEALAELQNEDYQLRSKTLLRLAFADMKAGRLHDSLARLIEVSEIVELSGPSNADFFHTEMATTLGELAIAENSLELFEKACEHHERALVKCEAVGQHHRTAVLESNHGYLLLAFNAFPEARSHLLRARRFFNHFSDRCPQLDETLARLHLEMGQLNLAEEAIIRSIATLESSDEEALLAESLRTHGRILCKVGRRREAKRCLDRAYRVAERCGDAEGAGLALLTIIEELSDQIEESELLEFGTLLSRLVGQSQRSSVFERFRKCMQLIASAKSPTA